MRIQFKFNCIKSLEAILWILNKYQKVNMYNLMKVLFHADCLSVNKYGKPITGDTYFAFQFGTVPEIIYKGFINKDIFYLSYFDIGEIPIEITSNYKLIPCREAREEYLSENDKECLKEGVKEYLHLSFEEVKNKNHDNKAYKDAYKKLPNSPIDWYDLIISPEIRDKLTGISEYLVV